MWHPPLAEDEEERAARRLSDREIATRLIAQLGRHRREAFISIASVVVASAVSIVTPYLVKVAIDQYISPREASGLVMVGALLAAAYVTNWAAGLGSQYYLSWLGETLVYEMRRDLFSKLQELALSFYDRMDPGRIISRVTNDTDSLAQMFVQGVVQVIGQLFSLLGILAIMFVMDVRLTLVSLTVILLLLVLTMVFAPRFRRAYTKTRRKIAVVTSRLEEGVSGVRETQAFTQEQQAMTAFRQANLENLQANVEATTVFAAFFPLVLVIGAVGTAIVLVVGGGWAVGGTVTVGVLVAFLLYVNQFFQPIAVIAMFYNTIQSALVASDRVYTILDTEPEVRDKPDAKVLGRARGEIEFRQVTFSYIPGHPVLSDINLRVAPGETVAIVGETGAGKTTLIKLLSRFYDPQEGAILLDGVDIRDLAQESLHAQMGVVLQQSFLFTGTVMENIRYGRLTASDEEVVHAAKLVGAHSFIEELPQGYNTPVGERGGGLSMGQRQLISFARALLRDPPILILDEATSSIDPYTELLIKRALSVLLGGRTSIVIAHRFSTVVNANRIFVLDNGRIVEQGSHRELLQRHGVYRRLVEMQFKQFEEATAAPPSRQA